MTSALQTKPIALVLGATGGIGGAVARTLVARGWTVRALNRTAGANRDPSFTWIRGDAMERGDVLAAAQGARLIVHAVNPPGYRNWDELVLPMLDNTIAASLATGATVLLPGTVYNFGPDSFPLLTEDAPQNPKSEKGKIRVDMERRLHSACAEKGLRAIVVRAGDFFGPQAANNWFSQGMVTPQKPVTGVMYPGSQGVGHQWAYLPDVAETMVRLVERGTRLPAFAVYHMQGFWDATGTGMIEAIGRAAGRTKLIVRHFPWWVIPFASPFSVFMRELKEMRYLWQQPLRMPNDRLVAELGFEPHTPIDEAVTATLAGLGCLPENEEELARAA
ncbi:NAD-dependent epimerase/dehydratase family protein [Pararhizobium sp.]|uniref:NAD-dependent epimerase/dehydratase family protein n=1 Tax=Pararhizobium sp. TaxID=1977563 RepID=UPI0027207696|nr:NAD-dependent epimerase/dehydratase family protein [Pararhizobium sp.]MDO9414764.1 NAD-dependent epimerase/dehydratase family protein [Pararhizobium sp.]